MSWHSTKSGASLLQSDKASPSVPSLSGFSADTASSPRRRRRSLLSPAAAAAGRARSLLLSTRAKTN
jgi:hypothetical protein